MLLSKMHFSVKSLNMDTLLVMQLLSYILWQKFEFSCFFSFIL